MIEMNEKEKPKKKQKTITVTIDDETYMKFLELIQREGYSRAGDFLKAFIRHYVKCNEEGSWIIDIGEGVMSKERAIEFLALYLRRAINHILDKMEEGLKDIIGGKVILI